MRFACMLLELAAFQGWPAARQGFSPCILASDQFDMLCVPTQVMQHPWVAAKAGHVVKPLSVNVTRGAATTAAARRFRSLVSGIAAERALRPLPRGYRHAPDDDEGTRHNYTARLAKQRATASRTRGYRWVTWHCWDQSAESCCRRCKHLQTT